MKKDTHPQYFLKAKVTCACGNVFSVGSTKPELEVEICSACHPFYTGKEKMIDAAGRVERFKKIEAKKENLKTQAKSIRRLADQKGKKSTEQIVKKVRITKKAR